MQIFVMYVGSCLSEISMVFNLDVEQHTVNRSQAVLAKRKSDNVPKVMRLRTNGCKTSQN